jgi:formylglycine-generating enzyme
MNFRPAKPGQAILSLCVLALAPQACSYPEHVFDLGTDAAAMPDVSGEGQAGSDSGTDASMEAATDAASDFEEETAADVTAEELPDAPEEPAADVVTDGPEPCPGTHGPTMVRVGPFCIDSTEVTNDDYNDFLIAKLGDMSGQPSVCTFNTTYDLVFPYWPAPGANPVRSLDWCDAYMFCQWAGKRLCGKIGGGPVPAASQDTASVDQWYFACTGAGKTLYPYGDTYDPSACRCKDFSDAGGGVSAAGSLPSCQGGFPGLYDMACNVWEWEDSCDGATGATDKCTARGASWAHTGNQTLCNTDWQAERGTAQADMGVRCCAP